ncbi:unnamed protein product [Dimorphilus gyrociliatus]|uniref:Uncharacterized protein n=1 Tax=Dimorphilus gyrociliatus TaxID=2664684 RepID=A0A7I8VLR9_9ANNE|nr:unnamed protein product [Dimorphilus gyrociliatus]
MENQRKLSESSDLSLEIKRSDSEDITDSENSEHDVSEDPRRKAATYLSKENIFELFRTLTAGIVYNRPENSVKFMINEIDKINKVKEKNSESLAPDQSDLLNDDPKVDNSLTSVKPC